MTEREVAHALLDQLPEEQVPAAINALEAVKQPVRIPKPENGGGESRIPPSMGKYGSGGGSAREYAVWPVANPPK